MSKRRLGENTIPTIFHFKTGVKRKLFQGKPKYNYLQINLYNMEGMMTVITDSQGACQSNFNCHVNQFLNPV
jgi:hypothetical protein